MLFNSLVNSGASAAGGKVVICGGASNAGVHISYLIVPRFEAPFSNKYPFRHIDFMFSWTVLIDFKPHFSAIRAFDGHAQSR